jgi:hypothetical protein
VEGLSQKPLARLAKLAAQLIELHATPLNLRSQEGRTILFRPGDDRFKLSFSGMDMGVIATEIGLDVRLAPSNARVNFCRMTPPLWAVFNAIQIAQEEVQA